jgi:hypothetical protein
MAKFLKQSTTATIKLGPFLDATDAVTAETALTIAQADIRLSKEGGDYAQTSNSAGATHDELGYYDVPLSTTDTGTVGRLKIAVHESGALPVWDEYYVLPAAIYDWLTAGAAPLSPTVAGRTLDVSAGGEAGVDWANVGSPTTTLNLSGTTVGTVTNVTEDVSAGTTAQDSGTAQGGGASTITLKSATSITLDSNSVITITGGTGVGQTGRVSSYNGTSKVATMLTAWNVAPDNTSTYEVLWVPLDKTGYALTSGERTSIAAAIGARTPTARNLTAVTAPTYDDCQLAAAAAAVGDMSRSGTTLTITHLDGTTAATKTLDDATTPTSRT